MPLAQNLTPKKRAFLAAYAMTCNISAAAELCKCSRHTHYDWLGSDPKYREAFESTQNQAAQLLEDEAVRRAYTGTLKPIFNAGERASDVLQNPDGTIVVDDKGKAVKVPALVREYSDTLLIFLLKGMRPWKYRDQVKHEHTGPDGGGITVVVRSVLQPADEVEA